MYCSGAGSEALARTTTVYSIAPCSLSFSTTVATGRTLLADGDVHANDAGALLIDDRVDCDGRLAGAPVADDQLALAAADRDHRVNGLDAGLKRLLHRLPDDDARRNHLHVPERVRLDRAQSVHRPSQCIDDPAGHGRSDRHFEQAAGAADFVALFELEVIAQDDRADVVLLEVQRHAGDHVAAFGGGELQHLAGLSRAEPVNARHTIPHFKDGPDFIDVHRRQIGALDFLKENFLEFAGAEGRFRRHKPSICEWKCGQNLACENYHMETFGQVCPKVQCLRLAGS
jgi:hypothetical protein